MLSNMTSVAALGNRNMAECLEATFEGPAFHPEREWDLSYSTFLAAPCFLVPKATE